MMKEKKKGVSDVSNERMEVSRMIFDPSIDGIMDGGMKDGVRWKRWKNELNELETTCGWVLGWLDGWMDKYIINKWMDGW